MARAVRPVARYVCRHCRVLVKRVAYDNSGAVATPYWRHFAVPRSPLKSCKRKLTDADVVAA